LSFIKFI